MTTSFSFLRVLRGAVRFAGWTERTHWEWAQVGASGDPAARAEWFRRACQGMLDILGISVTASGPLPSRGVIASNHLGYLDVLVLGARVPGVFVCKQEVAAWPVIGSLTRKAGTFFLDRERPRAARDLADSLRAVQQNSPVIFFPEGTSTSGESVLPFKAALLESCIGSAFIHPAAVGYRTAERDAVTTAAYWGKMRFVPHFARLLGRSDLEARVAFGSRLAPHSDRKTLARALHASVSELRSTRIAPWAAQATRSRVEYAHPESVLSAP